MAEDARTTAHSATRILVLEDNPTDLLMLREELRGYSEMRAEITGASTLAEALALAAAREFDVCLMDLNVPDSAGLATFERMQNGAPALPLIVFTGDHNEEAAGQILRRGAQDYLIKHAEMGPLLSRAVSFAIERNKAKLELERRDARLESSEKQVRRILEASSDGIIVVDRTGKVHLVNPSAEKMFGRPSRALLGEDIGFPVIAGQSSEIDILRPDRSSIAAEMRVVDITWEDSPAYLASLRDITERKRQQEALEVRAHLASLGADIGVVLAGADTGLTQGLRLVTDVFARYMRIVLARVWTTEEATGQVRLRASAAPSVEVKEDFLPFGRRTLQHVLQSGESFATNDLAGSCEASSREWVVKERLVSFAAFPIAVEAQVVGVLALYGRGAFTAPMLQSFASESRKIGQFITRKLAEEQLIGAKEAAEQARATILESSQRLNLALQSSRTGIWTFDVLADRVFWDERTHDLYGVPRGRFQGTWEQVLEMILPDDRETVRNALFQPPGERGTRESEFEVEYRIHRAGGRERYLASRGLAQYDEAGRLVRVLGTTQDVTDQRHIEEKLRQSQKMDAVGKLAGGIAHDFNNVLNVVVGYSSMLLRSLRPEDPAYRRIQEVRKAGDRGASLVRQLLAFSRSQLLKPRVLNLSEILREMDHMLRRLIGEDVEVFTEIDPEVGNVKADPTQIEQVILNLVLNARDAMPGGGKLTLGLRNSELDDSYARVHGVPPGRYIQLTVTDNGSGMSTQVREQAFEPFFTTKDVGKGTGLGLATVYGIIQQSGGHIHLYSEMGVGTTFKIYLPRVDETGVTVPQESSPSLVQGQGTVLLVEDDSAVREQIIEVLSSVGYTVIAANDGVEGERTFDQYKGDIKLLLTDVVMPKMGGREVARRLVARKPGMKVLFMSGYTGSAVAQQGILEPGVNLLEKPFTPEALCQAVSDLINRVPTALRILVVDDEQSTRDWLQDLLTQAGHRVATAESGRRARKGFLPGQFDLVITDLAMPDEEGIETIRALRVQAPDVKVIAISGAFDESVLHAAEILGAKASLMKPLTEEAVLKCISDVVGKE